MRTKTPSIRIAAIIIVAALTASSLAQLTREKGAIYLEDFTPPEQMIHLKVAHPAPIYYNLDGQRRLGTLKVGLPATILAVADKAYLIQAEATHALVKGWVSHQALAPHDTAGLLKVSKELLERQILVNDLIENHQVAPGMTLAEVKASLGEPDRINSEVTESGKAEQLEYVTYEKVPQTVTRLDRFGVPFQDIVYVKVETGKATVSLLDDSVKSIRNTEGAPKIYAPGVTIVPRPIFIF